MVFAEEAPRSHGRAKRELAALEARHHRFGAGCGDDRAWRLLDVAQAVLRELRVGHVGRDFTGRRSSPLWSPPRRVSERARRESPPGQDILSCCVCLREAAIAYVRGAQEVPLQLYAPAPALRMRIKFSVRNSSHSVFGYPLAMRSTRRPESHTRCDRRPLPDLVRCLWDAP